MSKWKPTSASERIMTKIASHDPSLIAVCSACRMSKKAESIADTINNWGQKAVDWASKDNYSNLKNVGSGLGTGLGTYALSGLVPGARKHRGLRALGALCAGIGAGMYGDQIRQGAQTLWDKTPWRQKEIQDATAAKIKADAAAKEQAAAEARAAERAKVDSAAASEENRATSTANPSNNPMTVSAPPTDADVQIQTNLQTPAEISREKAQQAALSRAVPGNPRANADVTGDTGEDDENVTLNPDGSPEAEQVKEEERQKERQRVLQESFGKLKGIAGHAATAAKGAYGTFKKHWDEAGKRVAEQQAQQAQQQADAEARALERQLIQNDVMNRPELTGDTAAGRFVDNAVSSARRGAQDVAQGAGDLARTVGAGTAAAASRVAQGTKDTLRSADNAIRNGYTAFGDFVNGNQYGDLGTAPEALAEKAIRAEWDKQEATMRRAGWDENRINRSRDLFFRSKRQEARNR